MDTSRRKRAHSRVLGLNLDRVPVDVPALGCQTQFGTIPVNPYLLGCDALAFAAWIWLLIRR